MKPRLHELPGKTNFKGSMLIIRKLITGAFFSAFLVIFCSTASAQVQVYVNIRPTYAPVVRPVPPGRAYIWIGEDWVWRGGRYVPVGGRWVMPPHPGYIWAPGRWMHYRGGWQWIPGRWRRHY
jgi:YXWGXW repeat-containing protein